MTDLTKDPQAILDYGVNWASWLLTDTITTSAWTLTPRRSGDTTLTIASNSHDTTSTTVWLSGGTTGSDYTLTNHIVTAGGREDDRSFTVKCAQR